MRFVLFFQPEQVVLRAPVSESLGQLSKNQLRKFAQYLIHELPRQILPTAQRLLDDLARPESEINSTNGAPDPTAGSHVNETSYWCLDEEKMHMGVKTLLDKFCTPAAGQVYR